MPDWEKLQLAAIGLVDILRERIDKVVKPGKELLAVPPAEVAPPEANPARPARRPRPAPAPHFGGKPVRSLQGQQQVALDALAEGTPLTLTEIASRVGQKPQGFGRAIGELVQAGQIRRRADGMYELAPKRRGRRPSK